eukprot:541702-Pelagomonas_calceolata.AAC.1
MSGMHTNRHDVGLCFCVKALSKGKYGSLFLERVWCGQMDKYAAQNEHEAPEQVWWLHECSDQALLEAFECDSQIHT